MTLLHITGKVLPVNLHRAAAPNEIGPKDTRPIYNPTMTTMLASNGMVSSANIEAFVASQRFSTTNTKKRALADDDSVASPAPAAEEEKRYVDHSLDPLVQRGLYLFPLLDRQFKALWCRDAGTISDRQILDHVGVGEKLTFPQLVHRMLTEVGRNNDWDQVVSWTSNGRAFMIHDRETFVRKIIPE